jgi:hypothetical protein
MWLLPYRRSITCVQTEEFSPNQIGDVSTRMSAAMTFSNTEGQSSRSHPVLGHVWPDAGRYLVVDAADHLHGHSLLVHDLDRAVGQRAVLETSGLPLRVQLM